MASYFTDNILTNCRFISGARRGRNVLAGPHHANWLGWAHSDDQNAVFAGDIPLDPLFIYEPNGDRPLCSPDLIALARLGSLHIDTTALLEDIWIGHQLMGRTLFAGIRQARSGESIATGAVPSDIVSHGRLSGMDPAPLTVSSVFGELPPLDRTALELSGGVDSRLVLAILLGSGIKPEQAFTLGAPDDPDVIIAANICKSFGIKHLSIDPAKLPAPRMDQIAAFVSASVFRSNAASTGWYPCLFERLSDIRDAQITGAGGECAEGFYFTPLDPFVRTRRLRQAWIQLRLFDGSAMSSTDVFDPAIVSKAQFEAMEDADASISNIMPWRDALWQLYRDTRMQAWALPVLLASSHWYTVVAPYLSPAYQYRAEMLSNRERVGRKWQLHMIAESAPKLVEFPFSSCPYGYSRALRLVTRLWSRFRRLSSQPPMRAPDTANTILLDERFNVLLSNYGEELGLRSCCSTAEQLRRYGPRLVGAVTTALLACEARDYTTSNRRMKV